MLRPPSGNEKIWEGGSDGSIWHVPEKGPCLTNHLFVSDVPRRSDDEVPSSVPTLVEMTQSLARHGRYRFPGAQDLVAVGMPIPEPCSVEIEDQVVRGILNGGDFLQHNLPFQLQVLISQEGIQNQIGKDVQGQRKMFVQNSGLEAGMFP
jgi:hypothetical protein